MIFDLQIGIMKKHPLSAGINYRPQYGWHLKLVTIGNAGHSIQAVSAEDRVRLATASLEGQHTNEQTSQPEFM